METNITELNLALNPFGNLGLDLLIKTLKKPACSLNSLNISETKINGIGLHNLVSNLKSIRLQHITLDKNDLRLKHMSFLSHLLTSGMVSLSMRDCNLGDDACSYIADALKYAKRIKVLSLAKNNLSDMTAKAIF